MLATLLCVCYVFTSVAAIDWDYNYYSPQGPYFWGLLTVTPGGQALKYPDCAQSNSSALQSPINIPAISPSPNLGALLLQLGTTGNYSCESSNAFTITLHDTAPQFVDVANGGTVYFLRKIAILLGSNHLFDGTRRDLEFQFIHTTMDGNQQLVVAVSAKASPHSHNDNVQFLLDHVFIPRVPGVVNVTFPSLPLNLDVFFPHDRSYATYEGSLTSPPCTQGVRWYVFTTPLRFSNVQLASLMNAFGVHADVVSEAKWTVRPEQPLNDREILRYYDGRSSFRVPQPRSTQAVTATSKLATASIVVSGTSILLALVCVLISIFRSREADKEASQKLLSK